MKRKGNTYIGVLFSSLIFSAAFIILMKASGMIHDTEKIVNVKKTLTVNSLSVIENIDARLSDGEQIELNNYSTDEVKVSITKDETSKTYLVRAKSEKNGIEVISKAVLFCFKEEAGE